MARIVAPRARSRTRSKTRASVSRASSASPVASDGDPRISAPTDVTGSTSTTTFESSNGHGETSVRRVSALDSTLLPGGYRSLSGISVHAFFLGNVLSASILTTIFLVLRQDRLWRLPEFIGTLALFHFLEFFTTAHWNTVNAKVSSYLLLSNGFQYNIAHLCAMLEIVVTSIFFPSWQSAFCTRKTIITGIAMVLIGQVVRSVAMAQAGTNFNHIIAKGKREGHVLVTSGIYAWLRHPSYFGYYWFAVGSQVAVGNKICATAFTIILWLFFAKRIEGEEEYLVKFFGKDYEEFRERTGTGLPFIR